MNPLQTARSTLFNSGTGASTSISRLSVLSSHLSRNSPSPRANMATSSSASTTEMPKFERSPVPRHPLGEGKFVSTAACLIIGDEVLNGKTKDSNSHYFARWCFDRGIDVSRIEVIPDDEEEIVEAARRMSNKYDFVITSGGIGPTPDDITYQSIAKAFGDEPLQYHDETLRRMQENLKARRKDQGEVTEDMLTARKRMALFPSKDVEVLFVVSELWVPVVRMVGKLCILPGIPRLFEALLDGLEAYVPIDPDRPRPFRLLIHTKKAESNITPFLIKLTDRCKEEGIKVGSYPHFGVGVDVSLIGTDLTRLQELGAECKKELDGEIIAQGKIGDAASRKD